MIKAIIFDVDGTLIDSNDAHAKAWQAVFREHGFEFPYEKVRHNVGKGADQYLQAFLSPEDIERLQDKLTKRRLEIFKQDYASEIQPFPCVKELFTAIRESGKKTALATSAKKDELQSYMKLIGIEDLLDVKTTADDAEKSKPHPDIFQAALGKLAPIEPAEALVIGDTPYDMEAAGKAGLRSIGFRCGGFPEDELRQAGASEVLQDAEELLKRWPDKYAKL